MEYPARGTGEKVFSVVFIKPSHYDDDGYVIQWGLSEIPSNTMAVLHGIATDCAQRRVLGDDVRIELSVLDETNTRIKPKRIIREIVAKGGRALIALVGVQTNQFPRAVDIARPFREAGLPVCIGGFHVSGCHAMLPELPVEVRDAMAMGISMFAGEAEGRFADLLRDAYQNRLEPFYDYMRDLPGLEAEPTPLLPATKIARNVSSRASFDSGRGCPFQCSFCTIINVQGRKSRYRSADDVEKIIREHLAQGIRRFFITDDNFARNRNWEAIFDRIIAIREGEGENIKFILQVDTLCHLIPNFVEKAGRAGVNRVFIGLENINPDNLSAAKKNQNRITEYRAMLQAWKDIGAVTYGGYILGFEHDTRERILRDIEIIQNELPLDLIEFFMLTPLPGSEDHQKLHAEGVWLEPDMNRYDTEHVCANHPRMSNEEFQQIFHDAWHAFYTPEHVERVMRRAEARGIRAKRIMKLTLFFYGCHAVEGLHPLQGGVLRRKYRRDRRPGMPIESPWVFYPRYVVETMAKAAGFLRLGWRLHRVRRRVEQDGERHSYMDLALEPANAGDMVSLEIFNATESGSLAVAKVQARQARSDKLARQAEHNPERIPARNLAQAEHS